MKKIMSLLLAAVLVFCSVFALAGCSKKSSEGFDLVLITDGAPINDGAYNQSAWNSIKSYGDENNMTYRYYQPSLDENGELSVDTIRKYIDLAADDGAEFVVLPGESFAVSAYEIAPTYSDIHFILVDALPHSQDDDALRLQSNVMCISFNALQAGFLAGYTSVIDGFTKLAYLGSVNSKNSGNYGSGFVQGAAFAADQKGIPVKLDYANYDAPNLDYDYSFKIRPVYKKVSEEKEKTFKVNVVGGMGSGVYTDGENVSITADPAPEGKVFDHWEVKSETDGVKDKKVNISSKKKTTMNLLVGDCDCTIKAVWADAKTVPVEVILPDADYGITKSKVDSVTYNVPENSEYWIEAPASPSGYVFDRWVCSDESVVESPESKETNINVGKSGVQLVPSYKISENPTFDLTVENGTGSGSYVLGDKISVVADVPEDGYMFYKWENVDNQGLSTGISMDNEYCYKAEFEMVDRYASIAESMYDSGTQVIFGGGNPLSDSIFTATWNFDYQLYAFGSGTDESGKGNCLASVVNDYGAAVKLALENYSAGSILSGDCSNNCIYVTGKNLEETHKDEDGNEVKNEDYNGDYAMIYNALAENKLNLVEMQSGGDVRKTFKSACLTIHYWITE